MFYHRLRYHMMKHLVEKSVIIDGTALPCDEKLNPSLERLIVMEWLQRMDIRLIKFVQEKFSTELNAGSNVLITMVKTLSKNIDSYIAILTASRANGAVSPPNPSITDSLSQEEATVAYKDAYRSDPQEDLASVTKDSNPGEGSNQGKRILVVKTKVLFLAVNIATYSL